MVAAILTTLYLTSAGAEEVPHHGLTADSAGDVLSCLSCHDGTTAKAATLSQMVGNFLNDHPVNRTYPPSNKADEYVPIEMVAAAGIALVNGQVVCISCHNLKNQEQYHLSVSVFNSNLCFACHIK